MGWVLIVAKYIERMWPDCYGFILSTLELLGLHDDHRPIGDFKKILGFPDLLEPEIGLVGAKVNGRNGGAYEPSV